MWTPHGSLWTPILTYTTVASGDDNIDLQTLHAVQEVLLVKGIDRPSKRTTSSTVSRIKKHAHTVQFHEIPPPNFPIRASPLLWLSNKQPRVRFSASVIKTSDNFLRRPNSQISRRLVQIVHSKAHIRTLMLAVPIVVTGEPYQIGIKRIHFNQMNT